MIFTDSEGLHQNYIQLIIYILCGLLELIIEPVIMYMNLHMENKFFPITISSITRVISNTIFVALFNMNLWGFTLSRIIGTLVYISYISSLGYFKYKLNFYKFIPKDYYTLIYGKTTKNGISLLYLREILYQFIKLNLLNFILSRLQNVVLSFIIKSSDEEKSDYSFISQNYGLITRFLFEPIIDAFYNLVNKIKNVKKKVENKSKEKNNYNKNNINKNYNDNKTIICIDNYLELNELELKEVHKYGPELEQYQIPLEEKVSKFNLIHMFKNNNLEKTGYKNNINYELAIKLLQLFLKILTFIGIIIIPYYLLIGSEVMGLIYGQKWQTNNIDKIGDCFSYYVIIIAVSDLIKNFGNATNDTRQMNLSYISLIINALFLSLFMFFLSKWDICGLIITNQLSAVFIINCNLYIIFCGKNTKKHLNICLNDSIISDIDDFIKKCFLNKKSMILTAVLILFGHIIKKIILRESLIILKILGVSIVGFINICLIYFFEYKIFMQNLNYIKSY